MLLLYVISKELTDLITFDYKPRQGIDVCLISAACMILIWIVFLNLFWYVVFVILILNICFVVHVLIIYDIEVIIWAFKSVIWAFMLWYKSTSAQSLWTCPGDRVFYDASVIWGLIGPRRIFGDLGTYSMVNWFFLGGAIAHVIVWLDVKVFPDQEWIKMINVPIMIGATGMMPSATDVNFTTWIIVGFLSGFVWYKYQPESWRRFNYVLLGALDAVLAFMGVVLYMSFRLEEVSVSWWGNDLDGCSYASCPTAKGIIVSGAL